MITITALLNKIKWDSRENPAEYEILYLDRVTKNLIKIKYSDIIKIEQGFMTLSGKDGLIEVPLHRIRKVMKKGLVIWQRGE